MREHKAWVVDNKVKGGTWADTASLLRSKVGEDCNYAQKYSCMRAMLTVTYGNEWIQYICDESLLPRDRALLIVWDSGWRRTAVVSKRPN